MKIYPKRTRENFQPGAPPNHKVKTQINILRRDAQSSELTSATAVGNSSVCAIWPCTHWGKETVGAECLEK